MTENFARELGPVAGSASNPAPGAAAPAPGAAPAAITPGDARSELNALMMHPAATDPNHPQHRELMAKRDVLYDALHGGPNAGHAGADTAPGADAVEAPQVDHLALLSAFEGGPSDPAVPEREAFEGGQHNRIEVAKALGALGATAEETKRLVGEVNALRARKVEMTTEEAGEHLAGLWGDAYEANITTARRALASLNNPGLIAWLDETGFGNMPVVALTLYDLGKRKGL